MLEAQPYPNNQRAELENKTPNAEQKKEKKKEKEELEDLLATTDQFFSPEEIDI
jgi:hypothetical protein